MERPTTLKELKAILEEILPEYAIEYDDDGQIVVYSGRYEGEEGTLLDEDAYNDYCEEKYGEQGGEDEL